MSEIGVGLRDGAEAVDAVDGQVVDGVLDGVFGDGGRILGQIEEDGQGSVRAGGGVYDFVRDGCVLAGFVFEGFDLAGPACLSPNLRCSGVRWQRRCVDRPNSKVIAHCALRAAFDQTGMLPEQLWSDRLLDEARHTADPVHFVRVFGIHPHTAVRYVHAAHPDKALAKIR
ncbi:hypothetical protein [Streptomyces sp. NRRL B-3229]|uniref:hypothetical protein n=1 Tax=Streptomyces sp. NRRL B-3229 TaxID=1463836 RepID=UPI00131AB3B2|nr:hypothetical protein [Streptomyces sp. NRRL B-3229]